MSNVPRITVADDPLASRRPQLASPEPVNEESRPDPAEHEPSAKLERYPEANISVRSPALLANRLKVCAAMLSAGPHGKVRVAELLSAVLAEHVDYADPVKLERLGELLERYRAL